MITYTLHLETKLVADGLYDVSVRGRPSIAAQAVPALNETEAMLKAAASLAIALVAWDQG